MVGGMASAAGKRVGAPSHPLRYLPNSFDGAIVQAENTVDGRLWSAWSYRNGGEYDLALSVSTAPGVWSEPILIGLDDGLDQQQPTISIDSRGATYVAYADGTGAIRLTALQPGGHQWSAPVTVASGGASRLSSPSLMVVGSALIVGFRDGDSISLRALPLLPPRIDNQIGNQVRSIYDGPDPTTGFDDDNDNNETTRDEPAVFNFGSGGGVSIKPASTGSTEGDN